MEEEAELQFDTCMIVKQMKRLSEPITSPVTVPCTQCPLHLPTDPAPSFLCFNRKWTVLDSIATSPYTICKTYEYYFISLHLSFIICKMKIVLISQGNWGLSESWWKWICIVLHKSTTRRRLKLIILMVLTGFQAAAGNFLRNVLAPAVSQNYLMGVGNQFQWVLQVSLMHAKDWETVIQ